METLSTKEVLSLRFKITNVKKDQMLLLGRDTMVRTKDGLSNTVDSMFKQKEEILTLDLKSEDHSMLSAEDCQTKSWKLLEEETLLLETLSETRTYNNSNWIQRPKLSHQ
jgi:hypothetical protein